LGPQFPGGVTQVARSIGFGGPASPPQGPQATAGEQIPWGYEEGGEGYGYEPGTWRGDAAACQAGFECCDAGCAWPCDPCWQPLRERLWVRGEYLMWWTQAQHVPPLVTTSLDTATADVAGSLGDPDTSILLGNQGLGDAVHSGGRISFGYWLRACECDGVEASYLGLGRRTARFRDSSEGSPILARPVFDTGAGREAAMLIAYPNLLRGSVAVDASTELQSAEVLWRSLLVARCEARLDFLLGYRFARLDERLRIAQFQEWLAPQGVIIPGTTLDLFDQFDAESQFHGAELGLAYRNRAACWSLELSMKVGLGNTHSQVSIDGLTQATVPGAGSATFVGGLLAQETNIGRYSRDDFAVLPELNLTLSRDLTCRLRATFGYTLLYWSKVARPAEQIDLSVSQFPPEPATGERRPQPRLASSDFWAQGLQFGLDYRF